MITLQSRDQEILCALALRVRLFSLEQLAAVWWSSGPTGISLARRRLAKCTEAGFLTRLRVHARPLPALSAPLISWAPQAPPPEFSQVAWQLQARWDEPPTQTTVYIATAKCANHFGGRNRGELKHDYQATHDLGVAAVYLHLFQNDPESADQWIGEDMLPRPSRRQKQPDAILAGTDTKPRLVLEFGGAYDANRIRSFHEHCAREGLAYQLW